MVRELSRASVDVTTKLSQLVLYKMKKYLFFFSSSTVGMVVKPEAKGI